MTDIPKPASESLRRGLDSKIVIVTGAAQGIGLGIAEVFVQHGATVVLSDIDEKKLESAVSKLGNGTFYHKCNVASWEQQLELFNWVRDNVGLPDIVCLNAGIDPELAISSMSDPSAPSAAKYNVGFNYLAEEKGEDGVLKPPSDLVFDINFKGVLYGTKLAIHAMNGRGGRIIVTSSASAYLPVPYEDLYASSKHAVLGLVRSTSQRKEVQDQKITLSMVAPWLTATPLTDNLDEKIFQKSLVSSAQDVAHAVAHLATATPESVQGKCIWAQGQAYSEVESSYQTWLEPLIAQKW